MTQNSVFFDNLQGQNIRIPRKALFDLTLEMKTRKVRSARLVKQYVETILFSPPAIQNDYFFMDFYALKKGWLELSSYQLLIWLLLASQLSRPKGRDMETGKCYFTKKICIANYQIRALLRNFVSKKTIQTAMLHLWREGYIVGTRPLAYQFQHIFPTWNISAVLGLRAPHLDFFSTLNKLVPIHRHVSYNTSICISESPQKIDTEPSVTTALPVPPQTISVPESTTPKVSSSYINNKQAQAVIWKEEHRSALGFQNEFKKFYENPKYKNDPLRDDYYYLGIYFFTQKDYKGRPYQNPIGAWMADMRTKTGYLRKCFLRWRHKYLKGETVQMREERFKKSGLCRQDFEAMNNCSNTPKEIQLFIDEIHRRLQGPPKRELEKLLTLRKSIRERILRLEDGAYTAHDLIYNRGLREDSDDIKRNSDDIKKEMAKYCKLSEEIDEYELTQIVQKHCGVENHTPYKYELWLVVRHFLLHKKKYKIFNCQDLGEWIKYPSRRQSWHLQHNLQWHHDFQAWRKCRPFQTDFDEVVEEIYAKIKDDPQLGVSDPVRKSLFQPPPPPTFRLDDPELYS